MSIQMITRVLYSCSETNPQRRLILIALANYASDSGKAWPSLETIAARTGLARRSIQRHINKLVKEGHLSKEQNKGQNGVNIYWVHPKKIGGEGDGETPRPADAGAAESAGEGDGYAAKGRRGDTQSVMNRKGSVNCAADASRLDSFSNFDALARIAGADPGELTKAARGKIEAALGQLVEVSPGLTPEEIRQRAAVYLERFPAVSLTPWALVHHWASLKARPQEMPEPPVGRVVAPEPGGWREIWPELFDDACPKSWPEVPDVLVNTLKIHLLHAQNEAKKNRKVGGG